MLWGKMWYFDVVVISKYFEEKGIKPNKNLLFLNHFWKFIQLCHSKVPIFGVFVYQTHRFKKCGLLHSLSKALISFGVIVYYMVFIKTKTLHFKLSPFNYELVLLLNCLYDQIYIFLSQYQRWRVPCSPLVNFPNLFSFYVIVMSTLIPGM